MRLALLCLFACAAPAGAATFYSVQFVPGAEARSINDSGDAALLTPDNRALVFRNGAVEELGPGAAFAINNRGDVVGGAPSGETLLPTIWKDGHSLALPSATGGLALSINSAGGIAGLTFRNAQMDWRATYWDQTGAVPLAELDSTLISRATDINDAGMIAGIDYTADGILRPVIWSGGEITELQREGDSGAYATALNNHGISVGDSRSGSMTVPVYWEDGLIHRLTSAAFAPEGGATDVNDDGVIVGTVFTYAGPKAFVAYDDTIQLLESRIAPGSRDWSVSYSFGINSIGQIAASGCNTSNVCGALILSPIEIDAVPEPRTWLSLLSGFALMGQAARARKGRVLRRA